MKRLFFSVLFIIFSLSAYSQFFVKKVDIPKFIFGFHASGSYEFGRDSTNTKYHIFLLETEPFISYYPIKNLGIGLMFDHMYTNTNYGYFPQFYSYGAMLRYYIPFQISNNSLDKHKIFLEYNISYTNYEIIKRLVYPTVFDKPQKIRMNAVVGIDFHIFKEYYIEIALQYLKFVEGIGFLAPRVAFEYHINRNNTVKKSL